MLKLSRPIGLNCVCIPRKAERHPRGARQQSQMHLLHLQKNFGPQKVPFGGLGGHSDSLEEWLEGKGRVFVVPNPMALSARMCDQRFGSNQVCGPKFWSTLDFELAATL